MTLTAMPVEVQNVSGCVGMPNARQVSRWASIALQVAPQPLQDAELCVRIVDAAESQALNESYRGQAKPTNVLSFPLADEPTFIGSASPSDTQDPVPHLLGDLVLCAPVLQQEAQAQHKALNDHAAHLVIHGVLHLLGYDHQTDAEAQAMESLEVKLLSDLGVANPYHVSATPQAQVDDVRTGRTGIGS